jgi:hypothetical protein
MRAACPGTWRRSVAAASMDPARPSYTNALSASCLASPLVNAQSRWSRNLAELGALFVRTGRRQRGGTRTRRMMDKFKTTGRVRRRRLFCFAGDGFCAISERLSQPGLAEQCFRQTARHPQRQIGRLQRGDPPEGSRPGDREEGSAHRESGRDTSSRQPRWSTGRGAQVTAARWRCGYQRRPTAVSLMLVAALTLPRVICPSSSARPLRAP